MSTRSSESAIILSGANANGVGTIFDVQGYRHVTIMVASTNTANPNLTLKAQACNVVKDLIIQKEDIDFSSASSVTNPWFNVFMYSKDDEDLVIGSTGLVYDGTSALSVESYAVNTDGIDFLNLQISGYTAGDISVFANGYNNK